MFFIEVLGRQGFNLIKKNCLEWDVCHDSEADSAFHIHCLERTFVSSTEEASVHTLFRSPRRQSFTQIQ